jgi:hypothetical protein
MFIGKVISLSGVLLLLMLQLMPTRAWVGWRRRGRLERTFVENFMLGCLLDLLFGIDGEKGMDGCGFEVYFIVNILMLHSYPSMHIV